MCHVGTVSSRMLAGRPKNLRKNPHIAEISIPGYDPLVAHSAFPWSPAASLRVAGLLAAVVTSTLFLSLISRAHWNNDPHFGPGDCRT